MALKQVNLSTDVYFVCLNHAMSTDGEEIVGLLCGEVDENRVAHVVTVMILRRSDKRKDRVEISPEQLSNASTEAERLACILKRPIRVIGWYHSHPKLTVWPSPIDVNTQDSYQLMDIGFIGVIFSVFNEDPNKKGGRIQMTCFQAQSLHDDMNEKRRLDIPVHLVPAPCISNVCMKALIELPRFICQEEQLSYQLSNQVPLDYLTRLHNSSVYVKSMGQIADIICGPLLKMIEERIINNDIQRKRLIEKKKQLKTFIEQAHIEKVRREREQMKAKEESAEKNSNEMLDQKFEPVASTSTEKSSKEMVDQKFEPVASISTEKSSNEMLNQKFEPDASTSTEKSSKEMVDQKFEPVASTSTKKSANEPIDKKLEPAKESHEKGFDKENTVKMEDPHSISIFEKSAATGDSLGNLPGTSADEQDMKDPKPLMIVKQEETDISNNNNFQ
ncbi:hypothetical protein JTE90_022982 [Oedothorax gibbosus]|uniref:MPN domain-containing protein n=1 Tax=Oedothorax gibbosus TaxID=931172 RepID=A0AAV6V9S1_9ARAC|nr:hypothetical protein JTE90_022982 [Oedothorax gibbosus]